MTYQDEKSIYELLKEDEDTGKSQINLEASDQYELTTNGPSHSILLPGEEPSASRSPKENQMIAELQRYKAFLVELKNRVEEYTRSTYPPQENNSTTIYHETDSLRTTLESVVAELIKKHNLSLELNKKPPKQFFKGLRQRLLGISHPKVILEANTLTSSWQPANEATGGFYKVEISIEGEEWLPKLQHWQATHPQTPAPDFGFEFYQSSLAKLEVPCRAGVIVEVSYVSEYELGMKFMPGVGPIFSTVKKSGR